MLILTRKVNERIMIGDEVEITVLKVSKDKVKLGIKAPDSVSIQREELLASITQENLRAASSPLDALQRLLPALRQQLDEASAHA
ncbi:MAG TPA: carbon storage regulator CsrA [Dehalococcoidia bacterium]|nr:carbon storage regulator CsrA [Dehalococcoidia bacterium]